jgi:hypothetical protein
MITTELKVKIRRTGTWGEVRGSGEVVGMLGEIVRICWNLTAARCHRVVIHQKNPKPDSRYWLA